MITNEEREKIEKENGKNGYGLTYCQLVNLIKQHEAARKNSDYHKIELIECRLTDINFHSECGLISKGLYKEALDLADECFKS